MLLWQNHGVLMEQRRAESAWFGQAHARRGIDIGRGQTRLVAGEPLACPAGRG